MYVTRVHLGKDPCNIIGGNDIHTDDSYLWMISIYSYFVLWVCAEVGGDSDPSTLQNSSTPPSKNKNKKKSLPEAHVARLP